MVNSIALISSPFQLVCLKEYIFNSSIIDIEIIFIETHNSKKNKKQVFAVANHLQLEISRSFSNSSKMFYFILFKNFILRKTINLILGDYFNSSFFIFSKIIKFKNLIFIDDGLATLFIHKPSIYSNSIIGKYFKWDYNTSFTVFSNFKNDNLLNLQKNNFKYLNSILKNKKIENYSILLGGNFIESGLTDLNSYTNILNIIKHKYKNEIIYIPHRLEDPSNYNRYPFNLLVPDVCFEVLLTQLNSLPNNIFGFYTTALITSKSILFDFDKINFINFEVDFFSKDEKTILKKIFFESKIKTQNIICVE